MSKAAMFLVRTDKHIDARGYENQVLLSVLALVIMNDGDKYLTSHAEALSQKHLCVSNVQHKPLNDLTLFNAGECDVVP